MYGEVYGAVSQVPGLRVFPRLDPPLPTPGQYDVELVLQSEAPLEELLEITGAVLCAGWQSGKFLYVDTDLKMDLPEARVVLDRERIADLGLDLAGVGQELGTLLGGAYVNRFNYFDRSYKVIPQIGEEDRATLGPLLDLKIKTPEGQLVPVSTFTRIETSTAPRTLNRFQQRNSVRVFGGVQPGVTKEEGLRVLEGAAAEAGGRKSVSTTPASRGRSASEGSALTVTLGFAIVLIYLVLAAQFQSFRDPLIVLLGSVPLAISGALVFSFLDLTTINIYSQVGLITLVGLIAKNGILIVQFANTLQARGLDEMAALREAALTRLRPVLMTSAARFSATSAGAGLGAGGRGAQQHRHRAGRGDDCRDAVYAVRRAGVLFADRVRAAAEHKRPGDRRPHRPVPRRAANSGRLTPVEGHARAPLGDGPKCSRSMWSESRVAADSALSHPPLVATKETWSDTASKSRSSVAFHRPRGQL